MRNFNIYILLLLAFSTQSLLAQTVVKMNLPPQSHEPLKVVALFDEQIPEGIPVVLGVMGYDVQGGTEPYIFEWMLNGNVISTGDVAIFTPKKGDDLTLMVTDNNKCRATTSFNLKVASLPVNPSVEDITVFPTVFKEHIFIQFPSENQQHALVRIFNMNGVIVFQESLSESNYLQTNLSPGTYFISVKTADRHKVEKIIAQ